MKKLVLLSLLALPVGTISAQQISGSFDDEWETCTPYQGGGSYRTQGVGTQPTDWKASNIYQLTVSKILVESAEGASGEGYSVYMHNEFVGMGSLGENAPAYLTLGTPWNTARASFTSISEQDGGTFGGLDFAYRPDSVRFSYKRSYGTETEETASVIAYLWKGEYSSTVAVGVKLLSSPDTETMYNRDKDVLGMITDGVTTSDDAECIASLNYSIEGEQAEWTTLSIPFTYTSDATPEKLNVIFSASNYFDRDGIGAGNSLYIDDVVLVYNSQLSSLTYDGADIEGFAADNYETLDMSTTTFDESKLAYTSNGAGATVETSFDEATKVLTITVKGNDYDTNTDNVHVYTVQFGSLVTGISVAGEELADFDPSVTEYRLSFPYDASVVIAATTQTDDATVTTATDDEAQTITLTATDGEESVTYTFSFTDAVADAALGGTYAGSLSVVLMGTGTELANAPIIVSINEDGTANLTLEDFTFGGSINVGDIYVPAIALDTENGTLSGTRTISFPHGVAASLLGQLPVTVSATIIGDGEIEADIDIDTEGSMVSSFGTIHVDFTPLVLADATDENGLAASGRLTKEGATLLALSSPYALRYVDLSEATIDEDVALSDLFGENDAPNTLVYAPESATLDGDNVILGTSCAKLVLTEEADFYAPRAFTAAEVSFDREFTPGATATVILPFSFDVPEGIEVSQLTGVDGSELTFSVVTTAEANTPYLIETDSSNPFDGLADVEVAATGTNDVTVDGVTHCGVFATTEVTSDDATTYYEWSEDGGFVQASSLTLVPFRSYLTSTSADVTEFTIASPETVGIGNATTVDSDDDTLYDLSGRRVTNAGKGIYIRGGKKVYIK